MIIGIPVYDQVDLLDVTGPYEMFRWAKFEIELVAERPGLVSFRDSFSFQVMKGFEHAATYDVLWVPGGDPAALAKLMGDHKRSYLDFLVRQSRSAKIVASVCEGALLLAAAGLLDGYEATTHWAFIPCLRERFPKVKIAPRHPRFHLDRNRLTGGGISSGLDEALKRIEIHCGIEVAREVQQTTQYCPKPPVTSRIPRATTCPLPA